MTAARLLSGILVTALFSCGSNMENKRQSEPRVGGELSEGEDFHMTSKILFVLTSHGEKGNTGEKTGFFLSEAAHPWEVLKEKYRIEFVSPKGGAVPVDGMDLTDPINQAFWENADIQYRIAHTKSPDEIAAKEYAAILFVGGHGTMWDFPENTVLAGVAKEIYENGGVVSAVCHGPAGLVNIKLSDGSYLVDGRQVTGFSNEEEAAVNLTDVVPFLLEDKLKARGGRYSAAEKFAAHVVRDGRLITGQNPASATSVGQAILEALRP